MRSRRTSRKLGWTGYTRSLQSTLERFVSSAASQHYARNPSTVCSGEYVKALRDADLIESEMTSRILKSSISILEAFNEVRNNRSLAHDNTVLNYEEALLIFNNVANSMRFLRNIELARPQPADTITDDDIPF